MKTRPVGAELSRANEKTRSHVEVNSRFSPFCEYVQKWGTIFLKYTLIWKFLSRSRWPRGLRCRSAAARLLVLWVRISPGAWMSVCCECCVLLGRGLCDGLITRPEESYRLWCVVECDLETSRMRRPWPTGGCCAKRRRRWKFSTHVIFVSNIK